jgi:hypothetical protein
MKTRSWKPRISLSVYVRSMRGETILLSFDQDEAAAGAATTTEAAEATRRMRGRRESRTEAPGVGRN